ncbi:putative cytochrome P450 [Rosa chinensis]|uniref:Putative cytochrome P450 n=1 Tax=Rosa chinensis TaxID=74649 RepID=A0A2P6PYD4_ROSCH|nr:putative cytochrome P450 [Rosa chinensis]
MVGNIWKIQSDPSLPTVKLSDPYWIPFGVDEYAQVIEVCKVPVSMGKFYNEEITCHVIDIEDTNVLFGRPWHESVKGGYCKDNTYLFRWESHKIKIKPGRKNIKNDHPEVCEKEHEEATLKIEEKLIKDKEADSFITSISMSCIPNCVQYQAKEKSMPIPFQVEEFKFQDAYSKLVYDGPVQVYVPFALQVLHLTLARLLQAFQFKTASDELVDLTKGLGLTIPKATPLEVLLTPRLPAKPYWLTSVEAYILK